MSTRLELGNKDVVGRGLGAALALFLFWFAGSRLCSSLWGQVAISEIEIDPAGVNSGRQLVEIRNFGAEAYDLSGHYLYFRPAEYRFPNGTKLTPQGIITVHLNRSGAGTPENLYTGIAGMRNLRLADAICLFSTNLFSDPAKMIDFVQWGAAGQAGEASASAAGLWTAGDFIDVSGYRPGASIAYDGSGNQASDWCVDGTPSFGLANDECAPPRISSAVRLNEIGQTLSASAGAHMAVELFNAGGALEDAGGYWIAHQTSTFQIPFGTFLLPGEYLLIHLGASGLQDDFNVYTGDGFAPPSLSRAGSIALFGFNALNDPSWLIDFVEWESSGQEFETVAEQAGLWQAGTAASLAGRIAGGSLAILKEGSGSQRWKSDNTPTLGVANDAPPELPIALNEVLIAPSPASGPQAVELFNGAAAAYDLTGHALGVGARSAGQNPVYFEFPSGTQIAGKSYLIVWLDASGAGNAINLYAGPFPKLRGDGDGIALLVTPDAGVPCNYLDFLTWGDNGSGSLVEAAVGAGIWPAGEAIATGPLADGSSIAYSGSGDGAEAYRIDASPSLGVENTEPPPSKNFIRGDCTANGEKDISDGIFLFTFLFLGGDPLQCEDACDSNDDAGLDISDPIAFLRYLFLGGTPLAPPSACGPDPTPLDKMPCLSYPACGG
ncbi:MAG: lamin tail domain-containing protein [Planctomycetes bacterium]|nr:lamin tail domain-containing protein [Planctomycetota bacterium]